ncbi:MAG: PAS domain S-box protein [Comamonadaceae bacterium]|nr:PAS domain S-box protein [Comamonadaceae bacterium]
MAGPQHWVAAVHPDDIHRVHAASERLLATGHAQSEYRIVRPDGSVRWLYDRASIIRDEYGNALRLGGIASDITERKLAEEQVRLLSAAVEQSPASIVIADPQGDIQYVNPKFTELTGYTFDEVAGRSARILKSGHTSPEEYRELLGHDHLRWHLARRIPEPEEERRALLGKRADLAHSRRRGQDQSLHRHQGGHYRSPSG